VQISVHGDNKYFITVVQNSEDEAIITIHPTKLLKDLLEYVENQASKNAL